MINVPAEQAVIGGLLLSASEMTGVENTLTAADFCQQRHGIIYNAIRTTLERADGRVDQLAIMETLRVQGDLVRVGGAPYLHTCLASVPAAVQTPYWASLVVECSRRRALLAAATRLVQAAEHPDGEVAREVVAELLIHV